jgi:hypothetical protein
VALNTTFVASTTVITAAHMNGIQAAWDTYTPTWAASGTAVALGNGTLTGKWIRLGKTVHYRIQLTMGSTTTFGTGTYSFVLPTAAHADYTANMHMGNGLALDSSGAVFNNLTAGWLSSTTVFVLGTANTSIGQTVPWTWAVSDKISIAGTYEAA